MQVDNVRQLTDGQLSEVLALVAAATVVDSVAPLSEQVLLAARDRHDARSSTSHFLAYAGTHLAGYAHLEGGQAGEDATGEVVVDPGHRRRGVGTTLVHTLEHALTTTEPESGTSQTESGTSQTESGTSQTESGTSQTESWTSQTESGTSQTESGTSQTESGTSQTESGISRLDPGAVTLRIWAHGHLDGARALALRGGYSIVRELWQMRRSLGPDATPLADTASPAESQPTDATSMAGNGLPEVRLPEGFSSRHFVVGRDEDDWLRVNAAAFVDHPEQGRMTRLDLDQRIAEGWFDAEGFILIEDQRGPAPVLAASHWTKVAPAADPQASPTEGEVYVVGVHPAYQGMGLGLAVTVLGLAHLRERGLSEATLYVDGDNRAAVATYARLGFTRFAVDIMYSRTVHPPV